MDEEKEILSGSGTTNEAAGAAAPEQPASQPEQPADRPQEQAQQPEAEPQPDKKKKKVDKERDKLREAAEKLEAELAAAKERLLRTAAEFDNYRKRTEREKAASVGVGTANAVEKLLPVLDTLELAAQAETADEQYKKGVTMTLTMFQDALASLGVEQIEDVGAMFDPRLHCAVAREQSEEAESGAIVKVMRRGYKMGDRVIRPSMVSVAE